MGFYINPTEGTKEQWLAKHGTAISRQSAMDFKAAGSDSRVVCWVDNGDFTAAGIAYNDAERDAFAQPDRSMQGYQRPKAWYLVKVEHLKQFCEIL